MIADIDVIIPDGKRAVVGPSGSVRMEAARRVRGHHLLADDLPDPADDAPAFVRAQMESAGDQLSEAHVAAWWAHEFAALGSRPDALRCLRSAWPALGWRRRLRLAATCVTRPRPQSDWS